MQNSKINNKNKLKISHWNANGIKSKLTELKYYIQKHNIDVMLINETKIENKKECNVNGYKCFRKDHNVAGGGELIYVKNEIECNEIQFNTNNLEAVGLQLRDKLTIVSAYLPPNLLPVK